MDLIATKRSIVVACDVPTLERFRWLVAETAAVPGVGAYKVGLQLALSYGLRSVVEVARAISSLPLIYDHQKGATDIPEMGARFADACKSAGVDAVVLFPLSGPETEKTWVRECQRVGLSVLVGAHMTHRRYLASEGGFIIDGAPRLAFEIAADLGVTDFVVPGNKPSSVRTAREFLDAKGAPYSLYAPGFITQGGEISECGRAAGERWHAIIGSAIYTSADPRAMASSLARRITDGTGS
jgi:orotidine-5'-phosphate decarboxylase